MRLRSRSGPGAAKKAVQNLDDLPTELRAADGRPIDITDPARTTLTAVSPDHIYPVDKIIREPGFGRLKPAQQREILELKSNYIPLSINANSSKGSMTMNEWFKTPTGKNVPAKLRPLLRQAEKRAKAAVRARIAEMLGS